MNAANPKFFENEMEDYLPTFERRIEEVGQHGLAFHTGVLRGIFSDYREANKSNRRSIQNELVQLEHMAKKSESESSAMLVRQIDKIKAIVGLLIVSLTVLPNISAIRRPNSGKIKITETEVEVVEWD